MLRIHSAKDSFDALPEVANLQSACLKAQCFSRDLADSHTFPLQGIPDFGGSAVNKLRPQLDRNVQRRIGLSEDPSTNAVAGFKYRHAQSRCSQFRRGRETSRSGADYDYVRYPGYFLFVRQITLRLADLGIGPAKHAFELCDDSPIR